MCNMYMLYVIFPAEIFLLFYQFFLHAATMYMIGLTQLATLQTLKVVIFIVETKSHSCNLLVMPSAMRSFW